MFGISAVRDEADIIRVNVLHHLSLGIDRLLIIDNGSSDGTARELERLGRDARVQWTVSMSPYREAELITGLAREAYRQGAEWVLKYDAGEFWYAPGRNLRDVLQTAPSPVLTVNGVINFIQRREQVRSGPETLLTMTRRIARRRPRERTQDLVTSGQVAYVEITTSPRLIVRTSSEMTFQVGGHLVAGIEGEPVWTRAIACLHAPLRSRSTLEKKADFGQRAEDGGARGGESWHVRRWRDLRDAGLLEEEWAANSYAGDALEVYGRRQPLIRDYRLRDLVAPWIEPSVLNRIRRWRALRRAAPYTKRR